ncbi:hypothetical protein SuNHUV7_39670 (plasmid) [Pseudoseohaeicola sp. NH-UV-7]
MDLQRVPLITSLPPSFCRVDGTGVDVGAHWLETCVRSWVKHGFQPVTVNSEKEVLPEFELLPEFTQLKVDKDGFDQFGKRYVALGDMIECVLQNYDGPIAITNSDIALDLTEAARSQIDSLNPGSCIVCNRIDIETPDFDQGVRYSAGFDFFVFHTSDLKKLSANGMYFGTPWWDYFLPVNLLNQGIRRLPSEGIVAYHLTHADRWKRRLWRKLGLQFASDMRALGTAGDRAFLSDLDKALKRKRKSKHKLLSRIVPEAFRRTDFYAVADLSVAYIDRAQESGQR